MVIPIPGAGKNAILGGCGSASAIILPPRSDEP